MELQNLKPVEGSIKNKKRAVGRGEGSKKGGTSTRGHKGAKSRSGYSRKIGFEGGQQPLQRRVPKFGFTSPNRVEYNGVNIDTIESLVNSKKLKSSIVKKDLMNNGLVQKNDLVKILGRGNLTVKINIEADAFSASAKLSIEKAGGTATIIEK
ncbi:MAG: 50S ribosomal protein L15 [Flavobacteriales bacterium]|jgi:large subunit ribosomal protein L15|nr:50S ribosomal protein L15 [Flavobacteriales bacterium]MDG1426251.1 50S ribosomal protein L15 [Flavobacteriales bacterium]MDG1933282.1 50S ribosomal protein L15 [Flavobacteriales bacterium]MDG2086596.1 50S ribosomal protein L15 [Flavobacteriales bacterium]|tara:strand:+ start:261 stop:719 length:459 start_codon:yes stop_codon:yes gene_type:complete